MVISVRSIFRMLLEPVLAAGLFCFWTASIGATITTSVGPRTETFSTDPYAVMIAGGFAVAIAIMRVQPTWSLFLIAGLLLIQLLYWPTRFGQTSWIAYLALPVIAFGIGLYAADLAKWIVVTTIFVGVIVTVALLTVPGLSLSGETGTLNGKPNGSVEIAQGFASWAVAGLLAGLAAWRLGINLRRRLGASAVSSSSAEHKGHEDRLLIARLSPRENEIYRLVATGMSNREISLSASIEESTVKSHVSSILAKSNVRSRAQLIARTRATTTKETPVETRSV